MSYAERAEPGGPPATVVGLRRGRERAGVFVPADDRSLSGRGLAALAREKPHVWKIRAADALAVPPPPNDAAPEGLDQVAEPFPEAVRFGPASLRSVVPVNQSQSIDGMTIALTAVERHDAAVRVRYLARADDPARQRGLHLMDVVAVDDTGRRYRAAPGGSVPGSDGGLDGFLTIAPAPARDVASLTVVIGTVGQDATGAGALSGPWVFPISLTP